jgi:hypothetical protein
MSYRLGIPTFESIPTEMTFESSRLVFLFTNGIYQDAER